MKEANLKNYLKTGALCFGLSLLMWNCRYQDDSIEEEPVREKKIQVISFQDFEDRVAGHESYTSLNRYFYKDQSSDNDLGLSKTPENNIILTDNIIKIAKEDGASYTFRLLKTGEGNEFYN
ncbi:MAG: hypothetical protein KDD04_09205, partial [Sinomicrobium sp.]|nr:hypothetical protein [Sinomicrobium sp.]